MATIAATDYQMPIGGECGESDGGRFEVTHQDDRKFYMRRELENAASMSG